MLKYIKNLVNSFEQGFDVFYVKMLPLNRILFTIWMTVVVIMQIIDIIARYK